MVEIMQLVDLNEEDYVIRSFFEEENIRLKIADRMKEEYFTNPSNKKIVTLIRKFQRKHGRYPTAQELVTGLSANNGYCEDAKNQLLHVMQDIGYIDPMFRKQLIENYFQYNVGVKYLEEIAEHLHEKNPEVIRGMIPKMRDALNFTLNINMGIHYIRDADVSIARLKASDKCIPSSLAAVRQFTSQKPESQDTCGGYFRKALSVIGGTSGAGKSMYMVNEAAFAATQGYNVVYITLELAEERVWERVAMALLDKRAGEIMDMEIEDIKSGLRGNRPENDSGIGNLFVKWMPTRTTHIGDIEAYINELEHLENIKVDMLVVDYLGIMAVIPGSVPPNTPKHDLVTYAAEQLRNFCIVRDIAGLTGTQFNRAGYKNQEVGLENTSDSMGLPNTADFFFAIIIDQALKALGINMHRILKNRFGPCDDEFYTSVNWPHMKVADVTEDQMNRVNDVQLEQQINVEAEAVMEEPSRQKRSRGGKKNDVQRSSTISGLDGYI